MACVWIISLMSSRLKRDDARIPETWQPRLIEIERSAESLKIKGNLAMNEGRYWDAITE
jgi:hypothetical protein